MPIKGLTNKGVDFPLIGHIRKGSPKAKNKDGIEVMGRDLTYFRVEFDEREGDAAKKFLDRYGAQPESITIVFPFNEIDRVWDAWKEAYTAGTLIHRCDGERVWYAIDPKTSERKVVNGVTRDGEIVYCSGEAVHSYRAKNGQEKKVFCKPTGRLRVVIPELQRLAYLMVHTTSLHDIMNLSSQLEAISKMSGGRISGIPLVLRRRPVKVSTPTANGRVRLEKWMMSIEADPEWVRAKLDSMRIMALPSANGEIESVRYLPSPKQRSIVQPDSGPDWDAVEFPPDDGEDDLGDIGGFDGANEDGEQDAAPRVEQKPPVVIQSAAQQGSNGNERPYPAERLRVRLSEIAATKTGKYANAAQRGLVAGMLKMCFAGFEDADNRRHGVEKYLWGVESSRDLTDAQVLAALDWLKPQKDSGGAYTPDAMAITEAKMVLHAHLLDAGQQEMSP